MKVVISDLRELQGAAGPDCHVILAEPHGRFCRGCFGCWTRTPGECVVHDGLEETGAWLGAADELLLISRCCFGSLSPAVKRVLDRAISYIHPYFEIRSGQMHHKRRYSNRLHLHACLYGSGGEQEENTMRGILAANAVNYDGELSAVRFYPSAGSLLKDMSL